MPAPVEGVTLADKLAVTRHSSAAGANIEELNTVRKQLSRIKGGGLAAGLPRRPAGHADDLRRAGRSAGRDRLRAHRATIRSTPAGGAGRPRAIPAPAGGHRARGVRVFARQLPMPRVQRSRLPSRDAGMPGANLVIGNNATAVDAAGQEAGRLGYARHGRAPHIEGPAEEVGRHLADMALAMRQRPGPDCLISGGEPVVQAGRAGAPRAWAAATSSWCWRPWSAWPPTGPRASRCFPAAPTAKTGRPTRPARCWTPMSSRPPAQAARPGRLPGPQRRLSFLRAAGRPAQDRSDAHQRVRHPGGVGVEVPSPSGRGLG